MNSTCYGCQNNIANQLAHMELGGCLHPETYTEKDIEKDSSTSSKTQENPPKILDTN